MYLTTEPMDRKDISERRKQKRFKAVNGAFAAVRDNANQLGQIRDISFGGLAFKYLANERINNGARALDIFISRHQVYIKNIPFQPVRDTMIEKENPLSTVSVRQLGVKFGRLNADQLSRLKHMIQHHTIGES